MPEEAPGAEPEAALAAEPGAALAAEPEAALAAEPGAALAAEPEAALAAEPEAALAAEPEAALAAEPEAALAAEPGAVPEAAQAPAAAEPDTSWPGRAASCRSGQRSPSPPYRRCRRWHCYPGPARAPQRAAAPRGRATRIRHERFS
ncbi:MAG TPA: hypothetical protein VEZ49_11135 [Gemmatimonadales bacterium]|nr:hypothetical protein [Gemmatimonadales bacterium]